MFFRIPRQISVPFSLPSSPLFPVFLGEASPKLNMQRYRSGHNEAVSKTVGLHGHVGSNPTRSAINTGFMRIFV